jgi:hypothetical protein
MAYASQQCVRTIAQAPACSSSKPQCAALMARSNFITSSILETLGVHLAYLACYNASVDASVQLYSRSCPFRYLLLGAIRDAAIQLFDRHQNLFKLFCAADGISWCMEAFCLKVQYQIHSGLDVLVHRRYNSDMPKYPSLLNIRIHTLMMDTTYCTPRWTFPSQQDAISRAADIVSKARESSPGELLQRHLLNFSKKLALKKVSAVFELWDMMSNSHLPVSTAHELKLTTEQIPTHRY